MGLHPYQTNFNPKQVALHPLEMERHLRHVRLHPWQVKRDSWQKRLRPRPMKGDLVEGWGFLHWKEPADGGAVASYKIELRERPAGDWALISVALESEATLNNQERNKDWEYRVIAVNKAGEGVPSNTVAAVV